MSNTSLKPIFKWSGGKSAEIKNFIKYLPPDYNIYIEPFVGSGALFFYLNNTNIKNIINDVHKENITFYQQIKAGNALEIFDLMNKVDNTEEYYYKIRDEQPDFMKDTNTQVYEAFRFFLFT